MSAVQPRRADLKSTTRMPRDLPDSRTDGTGQVPPEFSEDELGLVKYKERICVPSDAALHVEILAKGHDSKSCIHLDSMKMYADLKKLFW